MTTKNNKIKIISEYGWDTELEVNINNILNTENFVKEIIEKAKEVYFDPKENIITAEFNWVTIFICPEKIEIKIPPDPTNLNSVWIQIPAKINISELIKKYNIKEKDYRITFIIQKQE